MNSLIEELKQCYESVKNWKLEKHNQQYYRGLHDAYAYLIRFQNNHTKGED